MILFSCPVQFYSQPFYLVYSQPQLPTRTFAYAKMNSVKGILYQRFLNYSKTDWSDSKATKQIKDGVKLPSLEARIFSLALNFDFWKILFDIAKKAMAINHFCKSHNNLKTQGHIWSKFRKIWPIFMVSRAKKLSKTQFSKRPRNDPKMNFKPK